MRYSDIISPASRDARDPLVEARQADGNQKLLDYFQKRPISDDLLDYEGHFSEAWEHYAATFLGDDTALWGDLDANGWQNFVNWLDHDGHIRDLCYHDPQNAPAWMLITPLARRILPRTTWLLHFCANAEQIRREGFRLGVPDINRIALTRDNDVFGNVKRIRYNAPGYNFAYPTDGSVQLTARWSPKGYGAQALLFQSSGLLVHHDGDRERQVVFWGPSANTATAHVIKARKIDFVADNGLTEKSLDRLVAELKRGRAPPPR